MSHTTLGMVIDQLGPLVLERHLPNGVERRPVTGVVIDDTAFGAPFSPGCVVLGIGAHRDDQVVELASRAHAAGATALFVKHRHAAVPSVEIGVVEVAQDLAWEQLHAFVRTALLGVAEGRPGAPRTLFDVANALAVLVDGAIVIEDEHLRVVAYSSLDHEIDDARRATILGRQIPEQYVQEIREAGITAHLGRSAEPVRFDLADGGFLPRLAIALRSGSRTVGLLWAITDDEREPRARRVLADAAPDVAVELLRHLTADASRATDRLAAAATLLDGRPVGGLRELLGIDPAGGFVAIALRPVDGEADAMNRVGQFATVYLDAYRIPALVAPIEPGHVDIVVGLDSTTTSTRARRLLDELTDRMHATFGLEVRAAMGGVVADVRSLPTSRRDALAVLAVLADGSLGTAAAYDEVHHHVARRELCDMIGGAEHLRRGPATELLNSTSPADRRLVGTVRAYLDSGGDVTVTATELGVHRNTVRHRLSRFGDVTGLDLDDHVVRLITHVQLAAVD